MAREGPQIAPPLPPAPTGYLTLQLPTPEVLRMGSPRGSRSRRSMSMSMEPGIPLLALTLLRTSRYIRFRHRDIQDYEYIIPIPNSLTRYHSRSYLIYTLPYIRIQSSILIFSLASKASGAIQLGRTCSHLMRRSVSSTTRYYASAIAKTRRHDTFHPYMYMCFFHGQTHRPQLRKMQTAQCLVFMTAVAQPWFLTALTLPGRAISPRVRS